MSESNRLATDYEELTQALADVPRIILLETEGDPPERYDIEYRVKGFTRNDQGLITISLRHRVRITLPFGYPHFPPVCKPLTPIFHPDVDPDAVRIADFWEENQSLVELVFRIGELICGQVVHDEQPFNDEAAMWYKKHAGMLPLDNLRAALDEEEEKSLAAREGQDAGEDEDDDFMPELGDPLGGEDELFELGEDEEDDNDEDLDELVGEGLDFGDAADEFSGLEMASSGDPAAGNTTDPLPDLVEEPKGPPPVDPKLAEEIRAKLKSKEIFAARRLLNSVHPEAEFADREELKQRIDEAAAGAEEIYQRAKEHEDNDEMEEALELLKQVLTLARDYPGVREDISRMSNSISLMASLGDALQQKAAAASPQPQNSGAASPQEGQARDGDQAAPPPPPKRQLRPPRLRKTAKEKKKKAGSSLSKLDMPGQKRRLAVTAVSLVLLVAAITVGIVAAMDYRHYTAAVKALEKGQLLTEQKKYAEANEQFNIAGEASSRIRLIKLKERDRIQQRIKGLAGSLAFQEGLKGNVLYRNAYFPKVAAARLRPVLEQADRDRDAGKTESALRGYQKALEVLEAYELNPVALKREINDNISRLQLQLSLAEADEAEKERDWERAASLLREAIQAAWQRQGEVDMNELLDRLSLYELREQYRKGTEAFKRKDWEAATRYLTAVETSLEGYGGPEDRKEFAELPVMLVESRYKSLSEAARKARDSGDMDAIIKAYSDLLAFFDKSRGELTEDILKDEYKFKKIILDTRIKRDREEAERAKKDGDLARAVKFYEKVIATIDASDLRDNPTYQRIRKTMRRAIDEANRQQDINEKIAWLEEHFQEIVKKHYPSAKTSDLLNPKVTLVADRNGYMVFNLTCTERNLGRRFRLELNYRYNSRTGQWVLQQ